MNTFMTTRLLVLQGSRHCCLQKGEVGSEVFLLRPPYPLVSKHGHKYVTLGGAGVTRNSDIHQVMYGNYITNTRPSLAQWRCRVSEPQKCSELSGHFSSSCVVFVNGRYTDFGRGW
jgi:hypothetical protein